MRLRFGAMVQKPGLIGRRNLEFSHGRGVVVQEHRHPRPGGAFGDIRVARRAFQLPAAASAKADVQVCAGKDEFYGIAAPVEEQDILFRFTECAAVRDKIAGKVGNGKALHNDSPLFADGSDVCTQGNSVFRRSVACVPALGICPRLLQNRMRRESGCITDFFWSPRSLGTSRRNNPAQPASARRRSRTTRGSLQAPQSAQE